MTAEAARPVYCLVRRPQAEHPLQVWVMDFQFDATADGRGLRFLNVNDGQIHLFLAIRLVKCCKAMDVVTVVEELTSLYAEPT